VKRNPVRLWFWLHVVDVIAWRWSGSRAWSWALERASENDDWGDPSEWSAGTDGAPF
jgi:hypothetical protein